MKSGITFATAKSRPCARNGEHIIINNKQRIVNNSFVLNKRRQFIYNVNSRLCAASVNTICTRTGMLVK